MSTNPFDRPNQSAPPETDPRNTTTPPATTPPTPSAYRRILTLAVPTFGQLIAEPTFILIDTAIVGHIGDAALAGLSIGSTIILTAVGLCISSPTQPPHKSRIY